MTTTSKPKRLSKTNYLYISKKLNVVQRSSGWNISRQISKRLNLIWMSVSSYTVQTMPLRMNQTGRTIAKLGSKPRSARWTPNWTTSRASSEALKSKQTRSKTKSLSFMSLKRLNQTLRGSSLRCLTCWTSWTHRIPLEKVQLRSLFD